MSAFSVAVFVAVTVVLPFAMMEVWEWLPRWADRRVRWHARRLPSHLASRYEEEWLSDLRDIPGHLAKLAFALDLARAVPRVRHEALYCDLRYRPVREAMSRGVSGVLGASALFLLAPCFLLLQALVRTSTEGRAWQRWPHAGQFGRTIYLYRFRTDGTVGRILRRTGLCNLPLLVNVVRGDVNLVGPRAIPVADLPEARPMPQHAIRPGLVGPRVLSRRTLSPHQEAMLDVAYTKERSLLVDYRIVRAAISAALWPDDVSR